MTHKEMIIKTVSSGQKLPQEIRERLVGAVIDAYLDARDTATFRLRQMIEDRAEAVKKGDTERVETCDQTMKLMSLMAKEARDFDNHEIDKNQVIKFGLEDK